MASSSSSISWRYLVFTSFHEPDLHRTFLSHLRRQFSQNGIIMYEDKEIEKGQTIAPGLFEAIRRSRISIVVLSKNYARSSWCLDELVEILKCKKEIGNRVIPVFYEVNSSDVHNLTGDFGIAFNETCVGRTEEEVRRWERALSDVSAITGVFFHDTTVEQESMLIEKITVVLLHYLTILSVDFEDEVGDEPHLEMTQDLLVEEIVEAHLEMMQSLLHLDDEVGIMIVGIYGLLGVGKTTIAKALHNRLSTSFQFTGYMENLRETYKICLGGNSLKLHLQNQLLSKNLNQNGIGIRTIEELQHLKVLIILDNVDDLKHLDALTNETTWLGPGSRIVVTTENNEFLQQHGINDTYHVDFPSREEALKILCRYAFKQSSPPNDFKELAESVVDLCGNLPSRLRAVGLAVYGKGEDTWKVEKHRQKIKNHRIAQYALSLGYEVSTSTTQLGKSKSPFSYVMDFLVIVNLLFEITSVVADQLSTIDKPNFARISVVMSFLSVLISILDLTYKYHHPSRNGYKILRLFPDIVLSVCVLSQLGVSITNWRYTERRQAGPIKVSPWPIVLAIGMVLWIFIKKMLETTMLLPR